MNLSAVQAFISGIDDFAMQLGLALILFTAAIAAYVALTPHKELELIRQRNASASVAFAGVVLGLAIPLSACLSTAFGLLDLAVWGVVILLIQLIVFRLVDFLLRGLSQRIIDDDVAAAVMLFAVKLGVGFILAGAVSDPALSLLRKAALSSVAA
jgi:putative membrane protein